MAGKSRSIRGPAALLALALACGCESGRDPRPPRGGGPEKSALKIAVGGQAEFIYLPLTLAAELGYFREQGLTVEIADLRGGSQALAALLGGSVDVVCGFFEHVVRSRAQGKELVMFTLFDVHPGLVLVVGRNHLGEVHSIADLVGRPVGVTAPGSSTDQMVKYLLSRNGLDPQSIPVVGVGTMTLIAALQQDRVWAGSTVDPIASQIERGGLGKVLYDTRTAEGTEQVFGGPWPGGGLYTTARFLRENPRTAAGLAAAAVKALDYVHTHGAEDIAAEMPESFRARDPEHYAADLAKNLEMLSRDGVMPAEGPKNVLESLVLVDPRIRREAIDLERTYDNSFVREAGRKPR